MNDIRYGLRFGAMVMLCIVLTLTSCRTTRQQRSDAKGLVQEMLADPEARDVSGRFSVTYGSQGPLTIKARMQWNNYIHLSYSALGLLEVAAVDLLPRGVVIANRINGTYTEVSYSDIPYLDGVKVDFRTVQGLLWDRMFVYGESDNAIAAGHLDLLLNDKKNGTRIFSDDVSDFRFELDEAGRVSGISKNTLLYKALMRYSFPEAPNAANMPSQASLSMNFGTKSVSARLRYSGFAPVKGAGDGRIDISSLSRIPLSDMLSIIRKYL